jgi:hypothetical protein
MGASEEIANLMDRILAREVGVSVDVSEMALLAPFVERARGFREQEGLKGVRGLETGSRARCRG